MDEIRPLYDAIQVHRNEYSSGGADYSVTSLLNPPRVHFLNKRHVSEVDLFVEDLLHSYNGTGAHAYWQYCLEKIPNTPYKCEERLNIQILNRHISGAYDALLNEKIMYDMKNTSVWKAMFGDKIDWTAQQNSYRYMYWEEHGKRIQSCRIIALFRDWSLREMQRSSFNYPKYPAVEYLLPIWDWDQCRKHLESRVQLMIDNEDVLDDDLPQCTIEDMWSKPDQVAVKSTRVKRALRVLPSQEKADEYVSNYLKSPTCKDRAANLSFDVRPAVRTRCEKWCSVNGFCNQYQDYLKSKGN
jgi:hypothetical protein